MVGRSTSSSSSTFRSLSLRKSLELVVAVDESSGARVTGASAATGVPAAISTRLLDGLAMGRKNSELTGS